MPVPYRVLLVLLLVTVRQMAAQVPAELRFERAVEYQGPPLTQSLDVVWPRGHGPFPAVIVVHDGDFATGVRADVLDRCILLARSGFVAVALDYRLAPRQQFPSPVHDIKAGIRWLRANAARYAADPSRIAVLGYGSGGYLALFAGLTHLMPEWQGIGPFQQESNRVACVVSVGAWPDVDSNSAFLGGTQAQAAFSHLRANPLNWVTPDAAPVYFLPDGGAGDAIRAVRDRLAAAGVPAEVGPAVRDADAPAVGILRRCLSGENATRVLVADHGPGGAAVLLDWPSGRVVWSAPNAHGHDVQALPGGNFLLTRDLEGRVIEVNPAGKIVWQYGPGDGLKNVVSAQRLPNGNTLVADTQLGRVIEVTPGGKVVWRYESPDLANNRMRACRRTAQDTTLISVEAAGRIIEVDQRGTVVWSYDAGGPVPRRPYQALRLPNGNTLISLMDPGELIEVTRAGKVVRSIGGAQGSLRFGWASGFDVMPNGHLVLGDYTGQRLVEVDGSGTVVHELRVPNRPATVEVVNNEEKAAGVGVR